jgi:hypothetical protein
MIKLFRMKPLKWTLLGFIVIALLAIETLMNNNSHEYYELLPAIGDSEIQEVISKVRIGLSKEEVKKRFGADFTEATSPKDGRLVWTYEVPANQGNISAGGTGSVIDGLMSDALKMRKIFTWTEEGNVGAFQLYFKKDQVVYEYRLSADRSERLQPIHRERILSSAPAQGPNDAAHQVMRKLKIGMSKEQIKSLFGGQYQEIGSTGVNNIMWRYDIGVKNGFSKLHGDMVHLKLLKNDHIQMQLLITWDQNGNAKNYSMYYKGPFNDLLNYRLEADGGESVMRIAAGDEIFSRIVVENVRDMTFRNSAGAVYVSSDPELIKQFFSIINSWKFARISNPGLSGSSKVEFYGHNKTALASINLAGDTMSIAGRYYDISSVQQEMTAFYKALLDEANIMKQTKLNHESKTERLMLYRYHRK